MNKKVKLFVLIFSSVILLTGCTPKFDYEISDGNVIETVSVDLDKTYTESEIKDNANYYGLGDDNGYTLLITEENGVQTVTSTSTSQGLETFLNNKNIFNTCFNNLYYSYEDDEDKYYIGTSQGFNCLDYDYITYDGFDITIKTFNKVYTNDADSAYFGTYKWHIDSTNAKDKKITFVVGNGKYVWYYKYRFLFGGLALVAIISLIMKMIISYFSKRSDGANEI